VACCNAGDQIAGTKFSTLQCSSGGAILGATDCYKHKARM
jgi:hypothetical protein